MKKRIRLFPLFCVVFALIICSSTNFSSQNGKIQASSSNQLSLSPTIIRSVEDASGLKNESEQKPDCIILKVSEQNIVAKDGQVLGDINDVYTNSIKNKSLAVFDINDVSSADKFVAWIKENSIKDVSVMSTSEDILKKIKAESMYIRPILEFSEQLQTPQEYVFKAQSVKAQTVALSIFNSEVVCYIQARFKTVWARPSEDITSVCSAISSGAYGIILKNEQIARDALGFYDEAGTTRMPYFAAHRGLSSKFNENSIDGAKEAVKCGATHVELDVHLSSDNKLVVMHDANIKRTTNGEGNIADMTLAEIQKFKINNKGYESPIPTLEDFYKEFSGTNVIIVIEIKSEQEEIVAQLKPLTELYKMQANIAIISFYSSQIQKMNELFGVIPTSYLCSAGQGKGIMPTLLMLGSGFDSDKTGFAIDKKTYFTNRGYAMWLWTFNKDYKESVKNGVSGITTNCSDAVSKYVKTLKIQDTYQVKKSWKIEDGLPVTTILYDGAESQSIASVKIIEGNPSNSSGAVAILKIKNNLSGVLYSPPIKLFTPKGCPA